MGSPTLVSVAILAALCVAMALRASRTNEAERRRGVELAVAEERARIAQDLHDVVTHHVTTMMVLADATQPLVGDSPDRAVRSLAAISRGGRQALLELRQVLGLLDDPDRTPSLTRVGDLVERVRAAGQPVELSETGRPAPLPRSVDLTAYRVAQEALTNAVKHAHRGPTAVRIRYTETELAIEVTNDAPPAAAPAPSRTTGNRGLTGLADRVQACGGDFTAAPTPEGGFTVRAHLPLPPTG